MPLSDFLRQCARVTRLLVLPAILLASGAVHANITNPTPQRSYVSLSGSDSNNCGVAAPCRTWQAALAQTQPGGEILTLNSGGFGLLTITQAVKLIVPPGVYGGMSPPSSTSGTNFGITINAPGAVVSISGVNIVGQGSGTGGVLVVSAAEVSLDRVTLTDLDTGVVDSSDGKFRLSNSKVSNCRGIGLSFSPASTMQGQVESSTIAGNGSDGIQILNYAAILVNGNNISHNAGYGINSLVTVAPAAGSNNPSGFVAQGNQLFGNAMGAVSIADTSGSTNVTSNSGAIIRSNTMVLGTTCVNVGGSSGAFLQGNFITGCGTGVNVGGSSGAFLQGNFITGCGTGVLAVTAGTVKSVTGSNVIEGGTATSIAGVINAPLTASPTY